MNKIIPAPTIVPTKAVVNKGIPVMLPTAWINVGIKFTAITTAMMAVIKPVLWIKNQFF